MNKKANAQDDYKGVKEDDLIVILTEQDGKETKINLKRKTLKED